VSPAKAAINSDPAIAEKLTGAWLPYQEESALQLPAQSNYRLKAEDVRSMGLKLQKLPSEPVFSLAVPIRCVVELSEECCPWPALIGRASCRGR
jgi:hypothetical protein